MKFASENFVGYPVPRVVRAAIASLSSSFLLVGLLAQSANQRGEDDIFSSTNLLRIAIEIPEEGMQRLRGFQGRRQDFQSKPKAEATVTEGGRIYTNVTVQLKGFTTFQPVDGLPGLTLNFGKLAPNQNFHGLTKISLNNSLQDPTRLHEKLCRELFAAAGVPVPRADHAVVRLNGHELGLYVLTEGYDRLFLRRHFKRTDGCLFEGGVLQDIDRSLHVNSGKNPSHDLSVQRLISASQEPDADRRVHALEAVLDMDRFLSMMAMETILCHSDSYSMNRNNYRLYHDPTTDKLIFMPHGMDRVLGTHRSPLDFTVVPPPLGMVARAVLSTPEGRRRHVERAGVLFTNLFNPDRLCDRVRAIDGKIASARWNSPTDPRFAGGVPQRPAHDAEDLCNRISRRAAELKLQFANLPDLLRPTPSPNFDRDGIARIDDWKPKPRPGQPDVVYESVAQGEKRVLHLHSPTGSLAAAMRSRLSFAAGIYRLAGEIKVTGTAHRANAVLAAIQRYSGSRFAVERRRLQASEVNFTFQVSEQRAPEEIELICDIGDDSSDLWFDASSLCVIRLTQ